MNLSRQRREESSERRCRLLESREMKEIESILQEAKSKAQQAIEFVEYVAHLDQPVPADVSLRIVQTKARELLREE
jgi:hypothetical protein